MQLRTASAGAGLVGAGAAATIIVTPLLLLLLGGRELQPALAGRLLLQQQVRGRRRRGAGWSCTCWDLGHNGSLPPWQPHCCWMPSQAGCALEAALWPPCRCWCVGRLPLAAATLPVLCCSLPQQALPSDC